MSGPGSTSSSRSGPAPPRPALLEGKFQKLFRAGLPGGVESLLPPTERAQARPVARHVSCGGGGCFPQSQGQDPGRVFLRYYCLALRLGWGTPEPEPSARGTFRSRALTSIRTPSWVAPPPGRGGSGVVGVGGRFFAGLDLTLQTTN